jgi:hypothetical protein
MSTLRTPTERPFRTRVRKLSRLAAAAVASVLFVGTFALSSAPAGAASSGPANANKFVCQYTTTGVGQVTAYIPTMYSRTSQWENVLWQPVLYKWNSDHWDLAGNKGVYSAALTPTGIQGLVNPQGWTSGPVTFNVTSRGSYGVYSYMRREDFNKNPIGDWLGLWNYNSTSPTLNYCSF